MPYVAADTVAKMQSLSQSRRENRPKLHAITLAIRCVFSSAAFAAEANSQAPPHLVLQLISGLWLSCVMTAIAVAANEQGAAQQPSGKNTCVNPDRSQVRIGGGTFRMGSDNFYDEEGPVRQVTVAPFSIDRFDVTNAQFAEFVAATGYVTDAERKPNSKDYPDIALEKLMPGGAVFTPDTDDHASHDMQWWSFVEDANWRQPYGPNSSIVGRDNMPVIQVSHSDARAYAKWAGRDLPTEEQYEYAARGRLDGKTYAWGDELTPRRKWMANVWQGEFPTEDSSEDGHRGLAPVGCFPPNAYGLYDMVGNVWKWTSSLRSSATSSTPVARVERVIKGGSFMCSSNYCKRFRPAARQFQESSFSSVHLGFRTVSNHKPTAPLRAKTIELPLP